MHFQHCYKSGNVTAGAKAKKTQNRLRNKINTLETSGEQDLFAVIDVQQQKHFSNGKEKQHNTKINL